MSRKPILGDEVTEILSLFVNTFGYRQGMDGEWMFCKYCGGAWFGYKEKHDKKCPVGRARELLK